MPVSMTHEIKIRVPAETLFNYVTQPWLWHEWHPSSKSASTAHSFLATGDEFTEVVEGQPLAPLPPRMIRKVAYTVTESVPFQTWECEGKMRDGRIRIRYDFEAKGGVTFFSRSLDLDLTGLTRILLPMMKLKMEKLSMIALNNLKTRMQDKPDES